MDNKSKKIKNKKWSNCKLTRPGVCVCGWVWVLVKGWILLGPSHPAVFMLRNTDSVHTKPHNWAKLLGLKYVCLTWAIYLQVGRTQPSTYTLCWSHPGSLFMEGFFLVYGQSEQSKCNRNGCRGLVVTRVLLLDKWATGGSMQT